ncbi:MAG: ligase-associated DNA damage response exonuclease [Candidatus Obscuribacterales bacterium]|nr:ligase-associated DNA damage response exonuclease [Candidatus Obscuribacterales bacterium]
MSEDNMLIWTSKGLYCPVGDFYIDPLKKVDRAVITHAHSDHARSGSKAYLTVDRGVHVLRARIARKAPVEALKFGESVNINGVKISFHSAGHVLGSSQVRLEYRGEVWVASGDYKLQKDLTCPAFEPVRCHTFITESTFGLPVYQWPDSEAVFEEINRWWQYNREHGLVSILHGYSLGKSQRVLASVDPAIGPLYVHRAVAKINAAYEASGVHLPGAVALKDDDNVDLRGALLIGPFSNPHAVTNGAGFSLASASGWLRTKRNRKASSLDRGFILSDHADWNDLLQVIEATGAERVVVSCGYVHALGHWLKTRGISCGGVDTLRNGMIGEHPGSEMVDLPAFGESTPLALTDSLAPLATTSASAGTSFSQTCMQMDCNSEGKATALHQFLKDSSEEDATAALRLLRGRDARQTVRSVVLRDLALAESTLPDWIYRLCYEESGDVIETISLIVTDAASNGCLSLAKLLEKVEAVRTGNEVEREKEIVRLWRELNCDDRILANRILSGGFRIDEPALVPALSRLTGIDERAVAYQMKNCSTVDGTCADLLSGAENLARFMPMEFHQVRHIDSTEQLVAETASSGCVAELRWDGIPAQLVKRDGQSVLWWNNGRLLSDVFPEILDAANSLPDNTIVEGDILGWKQADVLPKATLQRRLRAAANKKLRDEVPVVFMAHDLLQERNIDIRHQPFSFRRAALERVLSTTEGCTSAQVEQLQLFSPCKIQLSPLLRTASVWNIKDHAELHEKLTYVESIGADGLVVKDICSGYGREAPPWIYVRPRPVIVNAALVSVRVPRGESEEAEFTLALLREGELVPVAKMSSLDLSVAEQNSVTEFIRLNTLEKFGPVRVLNPKLIFELACAGVRASARHKAGLTVRHCKVLRWCGELAENPVHSVDALKPQT